jgi:hypothetical protein
MYKLLYNLLTCNIIPADIILHMWKENILLFSLIPISINYTVKPIKGDEISLCVYTDTFLRNRQVRKDPLDTRNDNHKFMNNVNSAY